MRELIWLLPTAVCAAAVVWFGAQTINRDQTDPDSYEIHEHWFVLALGIICLVGGCFLQKSLIFSGGSPLTPDVSRKSEEYHCY